MKYIILLTICLLVLFFVVFFSRETIYQAIGDFLVLEDELRPADVIHVIAGPDHRTDYAIQLYKQGLGKRLFFTGGWCIYHKYNHGEHAKQLGIEKGVPFDAIAVDDSTVTSTYSEAQVLKDFIGENPNPVDSVIVVSDPHHMRRARWAYQQVLGKHIELLMAPVPFKLSSHQKEWWKDKLSRKMVKDEYMKFIYYYFRYKLDLGILREYLVSLDQ
jgi:uncharacterized SAM-binding protein YcdF (DUF218 family)